MFGIRRAKTTIKPDGSTDSPEGQPVRAKIKFEADKYTESVKTVKNPYVGFYHIYRFFGRDSGDYASDIDHITLYPDESLVLLEFDLSESADRALDEKTLSAVRQILEFFSDNDKDIIVRFSYDYEGKAYEKEPQERSVIESHMMSLGPVLSDSRLNVFMIQGLFIGAWGEMHHTRYLTRRSILFLYSTLRKAVGGDIWLALRKPSFLRYIRENADDDRLCLYNDAILSSESDMGTYGHDFLSDRSAGRPEEMEYQERAAAEFYNGGETVLLQNNEDRYLQKPQTIIDDLSRMHLSYLNSEYDSRVFDQWRKQKYPYKKQFCSRMNLYDAVMTRTGYRFVLKKAELRDERLLLTIINDGFSSCLFDIGIIIRAGGIDTYAEKDIKCAQIRSNSTYIVEIDMSEIMRQLLSAHNAEDKIHRVCCDLTAEILEIRTTRYIHWAVSGYEGAKCIELGRLIIT